MLAAASSLVMGGRGPGKQLGPGAFFPPPAPLQAPTPLLCQGRPFPIAQILERLNLSLAPWQEDPPPGRGQ